MIAVVLVDRNDDHRRLVRSALEKERDIAIVAELPDAGHKKLAGAIRKHRPDVLLLGAVTPEGVEAVVERVLSEAPVSIVVLGDHDGDDGRASVRRAIRAGAMDVVRRLDGVRELPALRRRIAEMVRSIRTFSGGARPRSRSVISNRRGREPQGASIPGAIVAIVASTGGPQVLSRIFGKLAPEFPAPLVVVQHMLDEFVDQFVDWLSTTTRMKVGVARDGDRLAPGRVYLAAPGAHLVVDRCDTARLVNSPPVAGLRPSADLLFESLAECRLERRVGVILSGMGSDGAAGLKALRDSGGYALAQDEASCAVYGMPRVAVERKAVDEIVTPDDLAARLVALVGAGAHAT